jgi:hypothetical protein
MPMVEYASQDAFYEALLSLKQKVSGDLLSLVAELHLSREEFEDLDHFICHDGGLPLLLSPFSHHSWCFHRHNIQIPAAMSYECPQSTP